RFNLENDAEIFAAEIGKARLQLAHVGFLAYKGIADDVRVLDDERERLEIIFRERRKAELAVGDVDAFLGAEFFTRGARARDFDSYLFRRDGANDAADLAIIERDRFAGVDAIEKFGQRDADARRTDQLFFLVIFSGLAGIERPREDERIADGEPKRLWLRRNRTDAREAQRLRDFLSSARGKLQRQSG